MTRDLLALTGLLLAFVGLLILSLAIETSLDNGQPTQLSRDWEPRYVVESPGRG